MSQNPYRKLPGQAAPVADRTATSIVIPFAPRRKPGEGAEIMNPELPRRALTAASRKISGEEVQGSGPVRRNMQVATWQQEAYAFLYQVGELRFATEVSSNAASQVKLELVRRDEVGDKVKLSDLEPGDLTANDKLAQQAIRELTFSLSMPDMIRQLFAQLFIVGEGYLVGLPSRRKNAARLLNYDWRAFGKQDVVERNGTLVINGKEYDPESVLLIKVWRPSAQFYRDADSPVRSILPVLRELVGLTMHISACIDSRLAGAGIVWMPQSATVLGMGGAPENADEEDPFLDAVIEGSVTAIKDRDSAAAVVPLFVTLPDDVGFTPIHMTFSTPFDSSTKELRDEAIRRLALGLDMPPEVLLGQADSSHWSAWSIKEDYLRLHILPPCLLIAEALVRDFLRPVLEELGLSEEDADSYSLLPVADHMFSRPNRFDEAMELYNKGVISQAALLQAGGFDLKDAPEEKLDMDYATQVALLAVAINPSLYESPGLLSIKSQILAALAGRDLSDAPKDALPPIMQQPAGPDNPADASRPAPESDKDKKRDEPGPAVSRERDK